MSVHFLLLIWHLLAPMVRHCFFDMNEHGLGALHCNLFRLQVQPCSAAAALHFPPLVSARHALGDVSAVACCCESTATRKSAATALTEEEPYMMR